MIYTKHFSKISSSDVHIAGGKGASLGEMTQAHIPVPPGFVVNAQTFESFLKKAGLHVDIESILDSVDHNVVHTIDDASEKIRGMIDASNIPEDIANEIVGSFRKLDCEFVAVRSSATSEDSADAAWAGQLETYLNTREEALLANVKKCWSSLFTPRAIFYRFEKGLHRTPISVAVVVQKMVDSEKSGIAFSVHPVTQDYNQLIIEAGFGLGETIVSGQVTPDSYVVTKDSREIIDTYVAVQTKGMFRCIDKGNEWRELGEQGAQQVLEPEDVLTLSKLILRIEEHYEFPVDVEWAYENGTFYITQSRPITTLAQTIERQTSITDENRTYVTSPLLKTYLKELDGGETLTIRGKYSPLFTISWILKYKDFPLYMVNDETSTLFAFPLDVYKKYAREAFYAYLKKDFDIDDVQRFYDTQVAKINTIYDKYIVMDLSDVDEIELRAVLEDTQNIFSELVSDTLFIEFLTEDVIEDVLAEFNYDIDFMAILDAASHTPFYSFEKRHHNAKVIAIEEGLTDDVVAKLSYVYTDYQRTKTKEKILSDLETVSRDMYKVSKETKEYTGDTLAQSLYDYFYFVITLRDYRKDDMAKIQALFQVFVEELCRRALIDTKHALNLSSLEAIKGSKYLKNHAKEIILRMEGSEAFAMEDVVIKAKKHDINIIEAFLSQSASSEVTGNTAHPGIAQGRVNVVLDANQADFSEGDVLVTSMTRPEFVPLMKKAAAVVTNEGGITCHAAIVSRELGIPCVIGTRNATQKLIQGQMVEVDATQGIVTVID